MSDEEWGPWIDHDGKGCPVKGMFVHAVFIDGSEYIGITRGLGGSWTYGDVDDVSTWSPPNLSKNKHFDKCRPIIKYRVKKPKGLTILEELLQKVDDKINIDQPLEIF